MHRAAIVIPTVFPGLVIGRLNFAARKSVLMHFAKGSLCLCFHTSSWLQLNGATGICAFSRRVNRVWADPVEFSKSVNQTL